MKKLILLLSLVTILSCSSDSDNNSNNPNSNDEIKLPTWLKGLYQADRLYPQFPYPKSNPYSLNFTDNDILVKGTTNSEFVSMRAFLEELKTAGKFVSIKQEYNTSSKINYKLVINYKNPNSESDPFHYIWEISPRGETGNLNVDYTKVENGNYGNGEIPYTKK